MFPISDDLSTGPRSKRRQVKKACTNCQKACKKCDDGRPCKRCITYGTADECVDTQRKERKKGIKRGPYKKREGKCAASEEQTDTAAQPGQPYPTSPAVASASSPAGAFIPPVGYPPGLPIITAQASRPGESPAYCYIPVPIMAPPPSNGSGQEGENATYQPHAFYPGPYFSPYPQAHAYVVHQRSSDGQLTMPAHFGYGPVYAAPPQAGDSGGSSGAAEGSNTEALEATEK